MVTVDVRGHAPLNLSQSFGMKLGLLKRPQTIKNMPTKEVNRIER
ncbi:hypothetical protein Vspart_04403 [Vibrio spartinae]|uniref:Uncharacterized protein n=1 Tax=Vibrio spartinae TaxID=1918945 RepID=A0A1N6MBM6_9VIBR|nr:hypothetical protein Vspart_04403 [Vibrio spartinae]SIO96814.1 hypothetical protein VSP9026_04639 [Vibrio spartinae]